MEHELHQLFDPESSTFTYVLVDVPTREAIVVDSVDHRIERDLGARAASGSHGALRRRNACACRSRHRARGDCASETGARTAAPFKCGISPADVQLAHGDKLTFGAGEELLAIHTPGHTSGSSELSVAR